MKKLLIIIGAIMVLGSIGSEEIGRIEFAQAVKQCLVGLPMIAIGMKI